MLQATRSDSSMVLYAYDEFSGGPNAVGQLTSVEDTATAVRQEFTYDILGRETSARERIAGLWYGVSRSLDPLGRTLRLTYPDNSNVDYQYGADGRIAGMPGFVSSVTYRPTGDLSHVQYINGISLDNTYDPVTNWLTRARAVQQTTGLAVADSTYGYTPGGHLSSILDAVGTGTQTFQMDHLYRLTQAASPASYGTLGYAYDARMRPMGNF